MIRSIITVLFVILFLILGLPVLGIFWIISKFNPALADRAQLAIVQWAFCIMIKLAGIHLHVSGRENIPQDCGVLYIGNHQSFYDIIVTYSLCPGLTGYVSKKEVSKVPILSTWMKRLYCLFIDRENPRQALKVILTAIDQIKQNKSIFIFPEGTRSKTGELQEFKAGSFKIASKTNCPIIPVTICGTRNIFENNVPKLTPGDVYVTYGQPIYMNELSEDEKKHINTYVQEQIQSQLQ